MSTARFIVADVFDGLATLDDGSVDLVVTSPPFLALRSYLPADHPDKSKEIGSESTPAEFIDVMLRVTAELRRVLAPHGSICIELGDTYAGSGGGGGDYLPGGMREGQQQFAGSEASMRESNAAHWRQKNPRRNDGNVNLQYGPQGPNGRLQQGNGWPESKSKTLIPQLYEIALAYGINPLTGEPSPAGQWRIRNVVTYCRPNPPVGALGDKWRPATSDLIVACTSPKRYWDDLATRKPAKYGEVDTSRGAHAVGADGFGQPPRWTGTTATEDGDRINSNSGGAPLLDYWEIPPGGYRGSHYAVFSEELVVPCVKAMCPPKVCRVCGEPSRRIVENTAESYRAQVDGVQDAERLGVAATGTRHTGHSKRSTLGFTDCGHDDYRPGIVLDPFAGSGTTLAVATGHGYDAIGIDLDERNLELARQRVGMFLEEARLSVVEEKR